MADLGLQDGLATNNATMAADAAAVGGQGTNGQRTASPELTAGKSPHFFFSDSMPFLLVKKFNSDTCR